jgi:CASPASE and TPR Repeat-associated protein
MMTAPVIEQEFVAHLFVPLDGPHAAAGTEQARRIWAACGSRLRMIRSIAGLAGLALPDGSIGPADGIIATRESDAGDRQAVLRRIHDVLNLSVALTRPAAASGPAAARRPGWSEFAQLWEQARGSGPDGGSLLGEARLFLARTPAAIAQPIPATAALGQSLDGLLPYREDRPAGW